MVYSFIKLGICAMDEKLRSSPMRLFQQKLKQFQQIQIIEIGQDIVTKSDIENWPIVDAFLCFYSTGFPLEKAISYTELRNPYQVNNLKIQRMVLKDRRSVYQILEKLSIPTPKKIYITRDPDNSNVNNNSTHFIEFDDHIECNGQTLYKPFIEKPFDAEDHNIYIYYPKSQGGGCRKLFRKIGDNSSCYDPSINHVRRDRSYIYEEFIELDEAKDVKVYSTPSLSYAELRKSPSVDGHVERLSNGKEKRFVTMLSDEELNLSMKINSAFSQFVCGFDILRTTNGKSYVCDVNGWSMVKGNNQEKFYTETCQILANQLINNFILNPNNNNSTFDKQNIVQQQQPSQQLPNSKISLSSSSSLIFSYFGNTSSSTKSNSFSQQQQQQQYCNLHLNNSSNNICEITN